MTGRPLRPVTDHCPGEPLPHQQANRTQAPPQVPPSRAAFPFRVYAVLATVSHGCPPPVGRFLRVPHPSAARHQNVLLHPMLPLDLHVLGVPPAFNLSHDQTLHFFISLCRYQSPSIHRSYPLSGRHAHASLFLLVKELSLPSPRILPVIFPLSTLHSRVY